jgi:tetratricopeptide (TPR) repeat protein
MVQNWPLQWFSRKMALKNSAPLLPHRLASVERDCLALLLLLMILANDFQAFARRACSGIASIALFLSIACMTPAVAQETQASQPYEVSPVQAKTIARQALALGDADLAEAIASALLERNPDDAEALMIRALIARAAGELDIAENSAAQAYRVSDIPALRFDAAFLIADIKARKEHFTRAQFWLRRADNVAPDDQRRAAATRAYQAVTRRNPLSIQLGFTLRPSNNINNGSEEIGEGPLGLSGSLDDPIAAIDASVSTALRYKLKETPEVLTEAYANIFVRRAILESGYADIVPGTEANDFDYVSLSFGLEHKTLLFPDLGATSFRLGYGGGYYLNKHYQSAADISFSQEFRFERGSAIRAGLRLRDTHRFDSPRASSVDTSLSLDYFPQSSERLAWSFGTTLTNYNSKAPTVEGYRVELRTRVVLKKTFFGTQPDLSASLSWRDLPEFDYFLALENGRQDLSGSLSVGLTYRDVSYFGFQPRAEFSWSQTNSEVDLWDTRSFSFGMTVVSRF